MNKMPYACDGRWRKLLCFGVAATLWVALPDATSAMWAVKLDSVPVERLARNLERFIKAHPDLPHGYFALGRVYSMAYCLRADGIEVSREGGGDEPELVEFHERISITGKDAEEGAQILEKPVVPEPGEEALRRYLIGSVENFRKAAERAPDKQVVHLGLGWVLENGATFAAERGMYPPGQKPGPELSEEDRARFAELVKKLGDETFEAREAAETALTEAVAQAWPVLAEQREAKDPEIRARIKSLLAWPWKQGALEAYRKAFDLDLKEEKKAITEMAAGEGEIREEYMNPSMFCAPVAYEAGQGIVRLLERHAQSEADRNELAQTKEKLEKQAADPRAVTPIILPLEGDARLDELLEPDLRVAFDLDGNGRTEEWPWVNSRAGFLVWDPLGRGQIASGLQLFGSVTWWIFWEDGYQPMAMLDDDGDGWLTGPELKGLAIWQDANSNGVSEPGEVKPVESWKIARLRVDSNGRVDGMPYHAQGLQRTDGSFAATYDWIPRRR